MSNARVAIVGRPLDEWGGSWNLVVLPVVTVRGVVVGVVVVVVVVGAVAEARSGWWIGNEASMSYGRAAAGLGWPGLGYGAVQVGVGMGMGMARAGTGARRAKSSGGNSLESPHAPKAILKAV